MILGLGVDTVEIERFVLWHSYAQKKLRRVFSQEEIDYCLSDQQKSAERFAVRFAAREALYKALSYAYPDAKIPFLMLCKNITVTKKAGLPQIAVHDSLGIDTQVLNIHVSLSHSRNIATAFVIIEKT